MSPLSYFLPNWDGLIYWLCLFYLIIGFWFLMFSEVYLTSTILLLVKLRTFKFAAEMLWTSCSLKKLVMSRIHEISLPSKYLALSRPSLLDMNADLVFYDWSSFKAVCTLTLCPVICNQPLIMEVALFCDSSYCFTRLFLVTKGTEGGLHIVPE